MAWTLGDRSGSQVLTAEDHLYETHINELRSAADSLSDGVDSLDTRVALLQPRISYVVSKNLGSDYLCGASDFHTQMQNAINVLPASGGDIHVLGGAYVATGRINVNKPNVTIYISNAATITISGGISPSGSRNDYKGLFHITTPGVVIDGGTVDCDNQANSIAFSVWGSGSDDSVYTTYGVRIRNMKLKNLGSGGVTGANVFGWLYGGNVNGSEVGRVKDVRIENVTFDTSARSAFGWIGDYFKDIVIKDSTFRYLKYHSIIQQNYLRKTSDRILIKDCSFEHTKIELPYSDSLCDIHDASRTGGVDLFIVGNKFTNKDDTVSIDTMAINIHEWDRVLIEGNTFSDMDQALSLGASNAGSAFDYLPVNLVIITNNTFDNIVSIVDNDAACHVVWDNNHFRYMKFRAIGWYSAHYYQTITNNHFYDCNDGVEDDDFLTSYGMVRADIPEYDYAIIENGGNDRTLIKDNYFIDDRKLSDPGNVPITVTEVSGGSLSSRSYYVRITCSNSSGETLASDEKTISISSNHLAKINIGNLEGYANSYSTFGGIRKINIYVGSTAGSGTLQGSIDYPTQTLSWTEPSTGLISGSALPTSNTTHYLTRYCSYQVAGYVGSGANEFVHNHVYGVTDLVVAASPHSRGMVGENYVDGQIVLGDMYSGLSILRFAISPPQDLVASVAAGGSLTAGTTYHYVVTAINSTGESIRSQESKITTDSSNKTSSLSWSAVTGATDYKIYRSKQSGVYGTTSYLKTVSSLSTTDTGTATSSGKPPLLSTGYVVSIDPGSGAHVFNGTFTINDKLIKSTSNPPASAAATGTQGQIEWDSNYIYVCVATNTWKRTAISTW